MIGWILWTLGGIALGGIVHMTTVLLLPRTATQDAFSRLSAITQINAVVPVAQPAPGQALLPFMDPAFATAVCRYDLSQGPLKLSAPLSQAYTSVSFYTRYGAAYYAITDRAAGRRAIELDLMTERQHSQMPEEEDVTAADRLIVESPTQTGLIVIKALSPEPSQMPMALRAVAAAKCQVL